MTKWALTALAIVFIWFTVYARSEMTFWPLLFVAGLCAFAAGALWFGKSDGEDEQ